MRFYKVVALLILFIWTALLLLHVQVDIFNERIVLQYILLPYVFGYAVSGAGVVLQIFSGEKSQKAIESFWKPGFWIGTIFSLVEVIVLIYFFIIFATNHFKPQNLS